MLPTHPGPEDLTIAKAGSSQLLVTGTATRAPLLQRFGGTGRIEVLDLDKPESPAQVVYSRSQRGTSEQDGFAPVGLHSVPHPKHPFRNLLYVANNIGRVDRFEVEAGKIHHVSSTPHSPLLDGINGLVATRSGTIYASTFGLSPFTSDKPQAGAPPVGDKPGTNTVLAFHPRSAGGNDQWEVVAHGFAGANGLALSPDESHLLVCSYYGKAIHAFKREPHTGKLVGTPEKIRSLEFRPDNLKALGDHHFSVAGQRRVLPTVLHFMVPLLPTASGAGECFQWKSGKAAKQVTDYTSVLRRDRLAPSTAIPHGSTLYTGHILRRGIGAWKLPDPPASAR